MKKNLTSVSKKTTTNNKQILNINDLEQSLWLVKVPAFVADRWSQAENNDILGQLKVSLKSSDNNRPPVKQLNVTLESEITYDNSTPNQFTLEETITNKAFNDHFLAFSTEKQNNIESNSERFCIDGKITKNLILKPQISNEYRQLIRDRTLSKIRNRREVAIADFNAIEHAATQSNTVEFITADKMELKRKLAIEKLTINSKKGSLTTNSYNNDFDILKSRVLEAFEQNERLKIKDIISYCHDIASLTKEKDIRDILETYGKYNYRGTFKQFWELKPEFKSNINV